MWPGTGMAGQRGSAAFRLDGHRAAAWSVTWILRAAVRQRCASAGGRARRLGVLVAPRGRAGRSRGADARHSAAERSPAWRAAGSVGKPAETHRVPRRADVEVISRGHIHPVPTGGFLCCRRGPCRGTSSPGAGDTARGQQLLELPGRSPALARSERWHGAGCHPAAEAARRAGLGEEQSIQGQDLCRATRGRVICMKG